MRRLAVMLTALALAACGTAPPSRGGAVQPRIAAVDAPVEFLLTSSAADFAAHRQSFPGRVRDVRIGYVTTRQGTRQYRLCGSFTAVGGNGAWAPFVTIQTDPYEQWLGGQAVPYCGDSTLTWVEGDFTTALQSRLDALR